VKRGGVRGRTEERVEESGWVSFTYGPTAESLLYENEIRILRGLFAKNIIQFRLVNPLHVSGYKAIP
jgi:hypothetical protein